jgi:hypothetical protein
MDGNHLDCRREGFMNAVGLLLGHADPTVRTGILEILKSFGDDLYSEVENRSHAETAVSEVVNPCPLGWHWDPNTGTCIQS